MNEINFNTLEYKKNDLKEKIDLCKKINNLIEIMNSKSKLSIKNIKKLINLSLKLQDFFLIKQIFMISSVLSKIQELIDKKNKNFEKIEINIICLIYFLQEYLNEN